MRRQSLASILVLAVAILALASCSVRAAPQHLTSELRWKQKSSGLAIASGANGVLEILSFDRSQPPTRIHLGDRYFQSLAVDAAGKRFIADDGRELTIFDDEGREIRTVRRPVQPGEVPPDGVRSFYVDRLEALELSPDGIHIAIVAPWFRGLSILNSETGVRIPISDAALNPSWSPDGKRLIYEELNAGESGNQALAPLADRTLRIFSLTNGESTALTKGLNPSWSPDGRLIAYHSGGDVVVAHIDDATNVLRLFAADLTTIRWSPDAQYLLTFRSTFSIRGKCFQRFHFFVYRLWDGAKGAVYDSCIPDLAFRWIRNPNVSPIAR